RFPLSASGRALSLARPEGYVEIVADRGDGTVLGVHMVGAGVAELAAEAALAVEMAATVEDLALTIAPHPTLSEALAEAALGAAGRGWVGLDSLAPARAGCHSEDSQACLPMRLESAKSRMIAVEGYTG